MKTIFAVLLTQSVNYYVLRKNPNQAPIPKETVQVHADKRGQLK